MTEREFAQLGDVVLKAFIAMVVELKEKYVTFDAAIAAMEEELAKMTKPTTEFPPFNIPSKLPPNIPSKLPPFHDFPKVMEKVLQYWQKHPKKLYGAVTLSRAMYGSKDTIRNALTANMDYSFESYHSARGVVKRVRIPGMKQTKYICIYHPDFDHCESVPLPAHVRQMKFCKVVIRYNNYKPISGRQARNIIHNHLPKLIDTLTIRERCYFVDNPIGWGTIRKLGEDANLCVKRLDALTRIGYKTGERSSPLQADRSKSTVRYHFPNK